MNAIVVTHKDSANRVKYKVKTKFSTFNSEAQPILFKDSANRVKYKVKTKFSGF